LSEEPKSALKRLKREKALMPSQKEAAVLVGISNGKKPIQAVRDAGFPVSNRDAANIAESIKGKYMDANGKLLVALDKVGVTMETVAERLSDGLNATYAMKSGSEIKHIPDYNIRHKYLETTLDVMGAKAPTKSIVEQVKTHEQTIAVVEGIRGDPEVLLALQRRLQQRTITITTTGVPSEPPESLCDDLPAGGDRDDQGDPE
jgi:hypothetical protein